MKTDYEKQAIDFLEKHNTTMNITFLYHGPYFEDDKENRDVYNITLKRGNKSYSFRFGQSIVNSIGPDYMKHEIPLHKEKELLQSGYKVMGINVLRRKRISPTAYDVLSAVQKYDPSTFENFCSDFGYDTDSRKAEKTYFAVQAEYQGLRNLFTVEELEEMAEIQ